MPLLVMLNFYDRKTLLSLKLQSQSFFIKPNVTQTATKSFEVKPYYN